MQQLENFLELGLSERSIKALIAKGFEKPSAIQKACIPLLLQKEVDVVGRAQTGTGKTAAFALPIIEVIESSVLSVQALILLPTRELALQVASEIDSLKGDRPLQTLCVYGGSSIDLQIRKLNRGVHIVVGTPGRVMDHLRRGTLQLDSLKFTVLDEADEMLNMGFIEDIETILEQTPTQKRMLMFSATMPKVILNLAQQFMREYELVEVDQQKSVPSLTTQSYYEVREGDKIELLCRLIDLSGSFYGLVFCRTKAQSDEVGRLLLDRGYNAEVIHGDLAQRQRELILQKLRERKITILVATDVAARGIDIHDLSHVINYSIPQNPEAYIHRIGRTGRAGKEGSAITFVTPSETRRFSFIRRIVQSEITKNQIPTIESVIQVKQERVIEHLLSTIEKRPTPLYLEMADYLLQKGEAKGIIATLLESVWAKDLSENFYKAIEQKERKESSTPPVRLFIAKGRKDGMTKRSLVEFIKEQAQVSDSELDDVQLLQNFSFVTTNQEGANRILDSFAPLHNQGRPIVTKAKVDNPKAKHLSYSGRKRKSSSSNKEAEQFLSYEKKRRKPHASSSKKRRKRR